MTKIHLTFILFISFGFTNQLLINPIFFNQYSSNGSDWQTEKEALNIFGAGISVHYEKENWKIESKYLQLGFLGDIDSNLFNSSHIQSLPYIDKSKDADGYWSEFSTAKISYHFPNLRLEIGKYDQLWGGGKRAIYLSNKAPSYPQFGFEWKIKENLKLIYFHGFLKSGIDDSTSGKYYNNIGNLGRSINIKRSIAGHRIVWNLNSKLKISANETVVYALRGLDIHYLIPVLPFYPTENYLGDTDNLQMGFDVEIKPLIDKTIYLSFFMDEFTPEWLLKKKNHNWFAWQFGFHSDKIFKKNISLGIEYNWTDQRVYKHKFMINDFYSHNQPLGFWAGPHAQEFVSYITGDILDTKIYIELSSLKRGKTKQISIESNYQDLQSKRFDDSFEIEEKWMGSIKLENSLFNKYLQYQIGLNIVEFKNTYLAKSEEIKSTCKVSFELGLYHNFNFLNY
jgi:hypothetical protein